MSNIFISGGGNAEISRNFDQHYLTALHTGKRILYIPRAFYPQRYPSCMEWISNVFPKHQGYKVHIISEDDSIDKDSLLKNYDGIYIGGGNTFRLLQLVRETGFIEVIQSFYEQGKPIYGGSAGAIILGKEIHTSPDINVSKLDFTASLGLNYFNGYAIFCHYQEENDMEIYHYIQNYHIHVIALPEGTGIYTFNSTYYLGGDEGGFVFTSRGKQKFVPGEEILF